ncbi:MAG: type II toxin-antitoxin system VapB family antitoxin [Pirellulales bacterium]|nr:type II toxin-antitoxin system VapB family antitoxin [Pirellulales bacterium]
MTTTTIQLEDELLEEAIALAEETGKSLTDLIEEALRQSLARRRAVATQEPVKLKVHGSGGVVPGIDLNKTAALLDLMESPDAAS